MIRGSTMEAMPTPWPCLVVTGVLLLLSNGSARADSITVSAHSSIEGHATIVVSTVNDDEFEHLNFANSSDSLVPITLTGSRCVDPGACANATINSVAQPFGIHVNSSTSATANAILPPATFITEVFTSTDAAARFDASFTIANTGLFTTAFHSSSLGHGSVSATLSEATHGVLFSGFDLAALSGTLLPGNYTLSLSTAAFANAFTVRDFATGVGVSDSESARADAELTFDMTPVSATPEPATLALFGLGLSGAVGRKRRERFRLP